MLRFDWRSCFFHFPRLATRCGLVIAGKQQARGRFRPEADLAAPKAKYTNSFGSLKPRRLGPDWRVECLHHLGRE